jgi:Zn-dependent M28 family amino/carboxypeptidase
MDDSADRAIGRAWRDDRGWRVLTALTQLDDRFGGHPGEHRAAELIADELDEIGLRHVTIDSFDLTRWDRGDAALQVIDPVERGFEAVALPYSPAGTVEGELVDVGGGTTTAVEAVDLGGKIALVSTLTPDSDERFVHRMEKYGHVVDAGAAGFVFHNHVPGQLPPTGAVRFGGAGEIPGIGVSKESGDWLVEYAERDGRVEVSVDAKTAAGTSRNVHGVLGPDTDDEILLVAHHDAHDVAEGALDNACGVAVVLTAADLLTAFELESTVRIATVGCEEIGLLGASALAEGLDLDRVKAVVNVDGAGRFRDLRAIPHGSGSMNDVIETVADRSGQPIVLEDELHPYSDHWPFVKRGLPAVQLHSDSGEVGRGWGHTAADTRDKVDRRNLRSHGILAALFVHALSTAGSIPRLDLDEIATTLTDNGFESGMRAGGIWPAHW